jgi:hypothetical protein
MLVWFGEVSVTELRWCVIEPAAMPFARSFIICLDSTHNGREINILYSFVNNVYTVHTAHVYSLYTVNPR